MAKRQRRAAAAEDRAAMRRGKSGSEALEIVSKKLGPKDQKAYDTETAKIQENQKKPEAAKPHRFRKAKWTHKNGHPRCLLCGNEESISGICKAPAALEDAVATKFDALEDGDTKGESGEWDARLAAARKEVLSRGRWAQVAKAIDTGALEDGGKKSPAHLPGGGLLEDAPRAEIPKGPKRVKAKVQHDDISKIRDVKTYDPLKVSDAVLRDDFRIVLAWYSTWKKDPEDFKHDRKTLVILLRKILKEAVRRGPDVIRFNPKGMTKAARELFEEVAREVKLPRTMLKRLDLTPDADPGDFSNAELEEAHDKLHFMYRDKGAAPRSVKGWSLEDVVNLHARVVDEMRKRDAKHPVPPDDGLDEVSEDFEGEEVRKGKYATVHSSGVERGPEIKLEEVLKHFKTFVLRTPYVYVVGGLANHGKTKGDIDVLVRDTEKLPEEFKHALHFRLGRALPGQLAERMQVHFDKFHGPFTNHVELYRLVLERMEGDEVIEMRDEGGDES